MQIPKAVLGNLPLFGLIPFTALQLLFPRKKLGLLKQEWMQDIAWLIWQNVFSILLVMGGIDFYRILGPRIHPVAHLPFFPFPVRLALAAIIMDFTTYWWHRALHRFRPLWAIHKLHHSSAQLTSISTNHTSVFEDLPLGLVVKAIPLRLLGIDWGIIFLLNAGYDVLSLLHHSNLDIDPPFLRDVFCTPNFHEWHHARENVYRDGQNFGVGMPIWDRFFGTSHRSALHPLSLGFAGMEANYPSSFLGRLFYPLNLNFILNSKKKAGPSPERDLI